MAKKIGISAYSFEERMQLVFSRKKDPIVIKFRNKFKGQKEMNQFVKAMISFHDFRNRFVNFYQIEADPKFVITT